MRMIVTTGLRRLLAQQDGATAIEYGLIAAGVAAAIMAAVSTLGGKVVALWTAVAAMFS